MMNNSVNSRKNKKSVGFQDVENLQAFLGPINPVDGMNAAGNSVGVVSHDPTSAADKCSIDCFYEKLNKLHESSGLSFVFNLQEAKLDLFLLYKAVIDRDGFHQVSKKGKWEEIISLFNMKDQKSMLPCQFKKAYENILYRYEQTYFYRMPMKDSKKEGCSPVDEDGWDCLSLHKKYTENKSKDCTEKYHRTGESSQGSTIVQHIAPKESWFEPTSEFGSVVQKTNVEITRVEKNTIDNSRSLPKPRTGFHIFVREECDRLKKIHGENPTGTVTFRAMAIENWKKLSDIYRQPYIEAGEKEREIYKQEGASDEQPKIYKRRRSQKPSTPSVSAPKDDNSQMTMKPAPKDENSQMTMKPAPKDDNSQMTMKPDDGKSLDLDEMENRGSGLTNDNRDKKPSSQSIATSMDDDYHVTLEGDDGNPTVADESLVESTIQVLKNARPTDPIFQNDWDCLLD